MREARLVGLSQDGKTLILAVAETGEEFAVPVDDRLRAALRGDRARLGQLEIQMESALRPRDIQARIRAGESPEAVAAVAQMPMERVMAFAGPVLAERDHVASLAQRASVRRRGGGDAPTRNLGAWVTERLRIRGVDPATAEWDAWRRDDGRWAVRVSYFADASEGESGDEKVAMFAYDAPGRYAVPDDDEARWLVGEQAQVIAPQPTSERRLTAVADFDLSIAPDHGADSYEAGFEDTISLPRGRAHQSDRDANRDTGRGFGRDQAPEYGHEPGREFGRGPGRDTSRDGARRDSARADGFRGGDVARGEMPGEGERGPRRVHSVPSPDEEPTLINVPIEEPPAVRSAVRAVERPAQPPVETSPPAPLEERAAAPENRFTERRIVPERPAPTPAPQQRTPEQRPTHQPAEQQAAPQQRPVPQPPTQRPVPKPPAQQRPNPQAPAQQPAVEQPAANEPEQVAAEEQPAEEPKKKPAKRASKRASVPSWDEIMFGKKAD
ncbi:septation protein SepH [Kribbella sp. NPDC006257]|uniref:septation protein SepH n=1 Tax=Kribbella sp. NPDC006257 TaxID=3156738 RepID=UPI0033A08E84